MEGETLGRLYDSLVLVVLLSKLRGDSKFITLLVTVYIETFDVKMNGPEFIRANYD